VTGVTGVADGNDPAALAVEAGIRRRLDATLLDLCSVTSPIGEERGLCDAVQVRLAKLELASPVRRYGDSLVVPVTRGRGPRIALVGHLDTVRTENGPARIEGDRCFGSGASDMKSGLAVMITLAEALPRAALNCDLTLVFYAREEGPFAENELGPVLAQDPELRSVDLAVCMEPSDNKLHLGCVGSIHATVTFRGRTAHSARPWEGDNAITQAGAFLAELRGLRARESLIEGLTYRTVTTVTQARDGGRGRNVVPDLFVLNVNRRFAPDIPLEEARQDLVALVGGRAEIEFTDLSPAARPSAEHPLVRALVAAGVRGVEPKQAWTDVARFAALGVAAINFGPGENAQAHQKNESTSLALLHDGYAITARWLQSIS
jgi:succinyl-diaminopimelate desuccinylase